MAPRVDMVAGALRGLLNQSSSTHVLSAASSPLIQSEGFPGEKILTPEAIQARQQAWQKKALVYATQVPELAGAASLVRGSASRVKLVIEGGDPSLRAREQAKLDAFDIGRAVRLLWLSGEFYWATPETNTAPYSLSINELDTHQKPYRMRTATSTIDMPDDFFRVWMPHDLNRFHATSPVQSAMELLDAMHLHQLADTAVATSRLAGAGILIWPTSRKREGLIDGKPARGSQEELLKNFVDIAQKAISDRKSLDATIPYVVFVDDQAENYKPELLRIDREDQAEQYAERYATYMERLGVALDLPVESVKGTGDASRFTAWQVREDKATVYLHPFVQVAANSYVRRHLSRIDPGFRIRIDNSALIKKPDATEVIMQMLQLRVVTTESALEALKTGDIELLVPQAPPADSYTSNTVTDPPSDFSVGGKRGGGDIDRGAGSFKERR